MSDTPLPPPESPTPEGSWELTLWNGFARFSDWFYDRLQWPREVKRKRLDDLRPYLSAAAWESLLLAIRSHLERGAPLDTRIPVQLAPGRTEWWQVKGAAQRDSAGRPVVLSGSMRVLSAEPSPGARDDDPSAPTRTR